MSPTPDHPAPENQSGVPSDARSDIRPALESGQTPAPSSDISSPQSRPRSAPASFDAVVRSRVLPRVSFRAMMIWTAVAAVVATVARSAGDGATLARAMMAAIVLLVVFFLLASAAFLLSWMTARLTIGDVDNVLQGNPFADDQLPPQFIKPREPIQ